MKNLFRICFVFLLASCSSSDVPNGDQNEKGMKQESGKEIPREIRFDSPEDKLNSVTNKEFRDHLSAFPQIKLPLVVRACEIDYSNLASFDPENSNPYVDQISFALGQFHTNGRYIATITLGAADCMLPILSTYKLNGDRIDRKTIAIGSCGTAPCFECVEYMSLKTDFTIYTADTIRTSDCDVNYEPIPGTEKTSVIYRQGKLNSSGVIELAESVERDLEN